MPRQFESNVIEEFILVCTYIEDANRLIVSPDAAFKVKMPAKNKVGKFNISVRKKMAKYFFAKMNEILNSKIIKNF